MKATCHYCKSDNLAQQSNNLCVECFNEIVKHYRKQKPAENHYLETLLIGLKPRLLEKLYILAKYMSNLDYCQDIIKFVEKGRDDEQARIKTSKDRLPGNSRANADRRRSSSYIRDNKRHPGRDQTQKRNFIQKDYQVESTVSCRWYFGVPEAWSGECKFFVRIVLTRITINLYRL